MHYIVVIGRHCLGEGHPLGMTYIHMSGQMDTQLQLLHAPMCKKDSQHSSLSSLSGH